MGVTDEDVEQLTQWLDGASRAVFFGGAGVSTESGIPDFRSAAGLYAKNASYGKSPEYLLSHDCLVNDPEEFFAFHRSELLHPEAKPNNAHKSLAKLEQKGKLAAVVTQNIDNLHQMAGSKTVYELHGSLYRNYCTNSRNPHFYALDEVDEIAAIPTCPQCGAMVRPDVVLYGEGLDTEVVSGAARAIMDADVLIVGGTSLNVYPAAGMLQYYQNDKLALVNLSATPMDNYADLTIAKPIGEVLKRICALLWPAEPLD